MSSHQSRMTPAVHAIFRGGFERAVELGHRHLGCEHLLLALVESDQPAASVLRARGLHPAAVREHLVRLAGSAVFDDLDADALTAVGIDLDAIRERALASLGPDTLSRAGAAVAADRPSGKRRWVRAAVARTEPGAWDGGVFLPHSPDLGELLDAAQLAGLLEPSAPLDAPALAGFLLSARRGPVPALLAALGVDAPALRAAVAEIGEPGGA
jgi:hypothetical protein